jgi:hypothetical protein
VQYFSVEAEMLTLEQIHKALQDRNPRVISEITGLHYTTVLRVKNSDPDEVSCDYATVKALSDYIERTSICALNQ